MLIDIHRHSIDKSPSNKCVHNLFHSQTNDIFPGEFYSVGLHPWHVQEPTMDQDLELVRKAAANPQIIAIGETGLDKTIAAPLEIQLRAFEAQIEIAKETGKPMVIHCVRAYNEVYGLKVKSHHKKPWIIHWFNANENMGLQLINHGFYLSFGHMLFNQESKAFKSFLNIPLEYIFFETDDAGYSIDEVYQRASELLSVPLASLEKRIEQNFINFFGFDP
jgi:TatD DNase family protein